MTAASFETLADRHSDRTPPGFNEWIREHSIQSEVEPIYFTVVTWVKYCSMEGATQEQLTLACMDLAISFFFLDDYKGDDYEELFDEFQANLEGKPVASSRAVTRAHADLLRRLESLGRDTSAFREIRLRLLEEYRYRNAVMRGKETISFERFYQCRLVTIDVIEWFELWLVLHDFGLTDEQRRESSIQQAVELAATFFFLGNDLYSVERDRENGEPNLVHLLEAERPDLGLAEAALEISRQKDEAHQEFLALIDELTAPSTDEPLRRCAQMLMRFVENAGVARHDNPERYVRPEALIQSAAGSSSA